MSTVWLKAAAKLLTVKLGKGFSRPIAEHWNARSLRRQMDSALYLRLAANKDKEGNCNWQTTRMPYGVS